MGLGIQFPREPKAGEPLDATWGAAVVRCLRALALIPGVGYLLRRNAQGTGLEILAKSGGGGTAANTPWLLSVVTVGEGESATQEIGVAPGLVSNPSGLCIPALDGVSLVASPAPTIAPAGSGGVVYLHASYDEEGKVTELVIEVGAVLPADTDGETYQLIGTYTVTDGVLAVVTILNTNQTLRFCDGVAEWY